MIKKTNRVELVSRIAESGHLTKQATNKFIDAFVDVISNAMINGETIHIMGFGDFEVRERAERNGVNPRSGKKIKIPKTYIPAFKPSVVLKNAVNKENGNE